jgi:hypothetical protein
MFWFAKRLLLLGFVISGCNVLGTDFDERSTSYGILLLALIYLLPNARERSSAVFLTNVTKPGITFQSHAR